MKARVLDYKPQLEEIITNSKVCHVGMVDQDNMPYVLPFNFGYANDEIFLHSAQQGKKIDILKNNPNVCVVFSGNHELRYRDEHVACSYSYKYESVLVHGKVVFVEDMEEKRAALDVLMGQYVEREFKYNDPAVRDVCVYKVVIDKMEGRAYGR